MHGNTLIHRLKQATMQSRLSSKTLPHRSSLYAFRVGGPQHFNTRLHKQHCAEHLQNAHLRPCRHVCRAETLGVGKLLSKSEIPAFIPRDDMMDQLYRWALIEAAENGLRNFGMPMKVEPLYKDEVMWGFTSTILKEGTKVTDIVVKFDDEAIKKFEWIDRGEDGFPLQAGNSKEVKGKNVEIWKADDAAVDEDLRSTIRAFCVSLAEAMNKYYSFGSVFSEEL